MPSPIVSATIQSTILSSISNILAQLISQYRHSNPYHLDLPQFFRFLTCTILTCPPNYLWQHLLERTFPSHPAPPSLDIDLEDPHKPPHKPPLSIRNTALKWFADCITLGALGNTVVFLVLMGALKGHGPARIAATLRAETWPIMWASYTVWPVASVVSFTFVPVERRIVFLSAVGLCWGVYMSVVAAETGEGF